MGNKFFKPFYIVFVLVLFIMVFLLVACSGANYADISFYSNGGNAVDTIKYGSLKEIPKPIKDGYEFEGWFFDDQTFNMAFSESSVIINDTALYAKWAIKKYKVSFVAEGATGVEGSTIQTVNHGTLPQAPTFSRSGYTFVGFDKEIVVATMNE